MSLSDQDFRRAVDAIDDASEIVLACHQGPDGDALGSMLALAFALRTRGRSAIASWGSDPFVVPKHYSFLPGLDLLSPPSEVPATPELMVTFDCGSFERLGTLEPNGRAAKDLIVVDHHVSNDSFGSINLIDPDVAASAILCYKLIHAMDVELDRDMAACLYTGVFTDTGSFKYRNTTPEVHQIASDLISRDIEHDEIARIVYDTHPVGFLKLLGTALDRVELVPEASMIWTWVTQADLAGCGIGMEDTEALIDVVRTADVAEVACVLKELPEGVYKVSMRAKSVANVGAVCESFGGGGHALAAGFTADSKDPRAIVDAIAAKLR
jgi:bifunctional oligoribonuclease and PAP phosphatase NrnA